MNERLIENWLTKSTERSFQLPFCFMLSKKGYKIIHMTRHCGMEHGKDIIAISPDDTLCIYQLKGSENDKITLSQWNNELEVQVYKMITSKISHPSITKNYDSHESYIVSNASSIVEEVTFRIEELNNVFESKGFGRVSIILKHDMIEWSKYMGTDFLPTDFAPFQSLLEFYLQDGKSNLPKKKLTYLLFTHLLQSESLKKDELKRAVSSAALLCSLAITSYSNVNNHVACIEAWTIFICYSASTVEKYKHPIKLIEEEIKVAEKAIYVCFENLIEEIITKEDLLEGDALTDGWVYKARATWILGLISSFCHLKNANNIDADWTSEMSIFEKYFSSLELWGEGAVPQFASIFFSKRFVANQYSIDALHICFSTILQASLVPSNTFLPPYLDYEEVSISTLIPKPQKKQFFYYTLNSLIYLLTSSGQRDFLACHWKNISKTQWINFQTENTYELLLWKNRKGKETTITPKETQSWKELQDISQDIDMERVPLLFQYKPYLLPLFFVVYPHRFEPNLVKYTYSVLAK